MSKLIRLLKNPPQRKLNPPIETVDIDARTIYTQLTEFDYKKWERRIKESVYIEIVELIGKEENPHPVPETPQCGYSEFHRFVDNCKIDVREKYRQELLEKLRKWKDG